MYKQKQLPYCLSKRRPKPTYGVDRSHKKNLQILQTYVVSPPKNSDNTIYELVQREKLEALKRKSRKQYVVLNPKTKYIKNVKTQFSDHENQQMQELRNLKNDIRNLQREVQSKKAQQQYQGQYMSQIRDIKTEIQQLKNIQREIEEKKSQLQEQDEYINRLDSLKTQIKDLHEQMKQKRSSPFLPPIHIHPAVNLNPQNLPISRKYVQKPINRRAFSVQGSNNNELDQLREQVQQLRRQLTLQKKFKNNNSPYLPKLSRVYDRNDRSNVYSAVRDFARNNFSRKNLDTIQVSDFRPKANQSQVSQSARFKQWKQQIRASAWRKVRNVVNVIYFARNLQRIAQRIRMKRENFFRDSFQQNIYNQVTVIKDTFVKCTQDFIQALPTSQNQFLVVVATDNEKQRETKVDLTKKYLNIFLDTIRETQFSPELMQTLTQTCYFVCRHGSAGVLSNYFTAEELDIMCVSKASLKVCSQKNLQKSHIISFIWIKLIVFNILLRTDTLKQLALDNNPVWNNNFFLIGSILYEVARKLQAQLIERVPLNYIIGNWKHINFLNSKISLSKKAINPSKSMTISFSPIEKSILIDKNPNELIQGTISKVFLNEAYNLDNWDAEERKITNFINLIHRRICKYHSKLKSEL